MWTQVEHDLLQLLSSRVFPGLRGIPAYEKLLKPNGQPDPLACKTAAHALIHSSDLKSGIREFGSREAPKAREWSQAYLPGGLTQEQSQWRLVVR